MADPARPAARDVRGRGGAAGVVRGDAVPRRRLDAQSPHAHRGPRASGRGSGLRHAPTRAPDVPPAPARDPEDRRAARCNSLRGHDVLASGADARSAADPARVKRRVLGRTGLAVSPIGFGAWAIGGNRFGNSYGSTDDAESGRAVRRAHELGCNFFDTADVYGHGHSEEILGQVLGEGALRQDVIIATKVGGNFYNRDVNPLLLPRLAEALGRPVADIAPDAGLPVA